MMMKREKISNKTDFFENENGNYSLVLVVSKMSQSEASICCTFNSARGLTSSLFIENMTYQKTPIAFFSRLRKAKLLLSTLSQPFLFYCNDLDFGDNVVHQAQCRAL